MGGGKTQRFRPVAAAAAAAARRARMSVTFDPFLGAALGAGTPASSTRPSRRHTATTSTADTRGVTGAGAGRRCEAPRLPHHTANQAVSHPESWRAHGRGKGGGAHGTRTTNTHQRPRGTLCYPDTHATIPGMVWGKQQAPAAALRMQPPYCPHECARRHTWQCPQHRGDAAQDAHDGVLGRGHVQHELNCLPAGLEVHTPHHGPSLAHKGAKRRRVHVRSVVTGQVYVRVGVCARFCARGEIAPRPTRRSHGCWPPYRVGPRAHARLWWRNSAFPEDWGVRIHSNSQPQQRRSCKRNDESLQQQGSSAGMGTPSAVAQASSCPGKLMPRQAHALDLIMPAILVAISCASDSCVKNSKNSPSRSMKYITMEWSTAAQQQGRRRGRGGGRMGR
jgi:hypothetical protein